MVCSSWLALESREMIRDLLFLVRVVNRSCVRLGLRFLSIRVFLLRFLLLFMMLLVPLVTIRFITIDRFFVDFLLLALFLWFYQCAFIELVV